MTDSIDIFTGILLTVIGLFLVYGSIAFRLIDLILILGVIITLFGLYKLLPAFLLRLMDSRNSNNSRPGLSNSRNNSTTRLGSSNNSNSNTSSILQTGAKELSNFLNGEDDKNNNSKSVLRVNDSYDSNYLDSSNESNTNFSTEYTPKNIKPIYKDSSIDESKQVLRTKPVEEEKPLIKLPSFRRTSNNKTKSQRNSKNRSSPLRTSNNGRNSSRSSNVDDGTNANNRLIPQGNYAYLEEENNQSSDLVYFTPNYEKPMKVTRRPKKKSPGKINLGSVPKRSNEISKALASVGDAETIYDNNVSEDSYSLMPKTIDEEMIMPLADFEIDAGEESVYNLVQSKNTIYNNEIYEEDDYSITPIHAENNNDLDISLEEGSLDSVSDDLGSSVDNDVLISNLEESGDSQTILEIKSENTQDSVEEIDDNGQYASSVDLLNQISNNEDIPSPSLKTKCQDVSVLPRPTSISSTNPISRKENVLNLSRPHKKSTGVNNVTQSSDEDILSRQSVGDNGDVLSSQSASIDEIENIVNKPSGPGNAINNIVNSVMAESTSDDLGSNEELISKEDLDNIIPDDGESISKEDLNNIISDDEEQTIKIDPNNPESLPIPKLLNSYVICEKGILTSQEAFEEVASHSKEEILLEAPSIKDMGERFLSSIANIKTRVIIQEFDLDDISYVLLLSSLIKKGVEIKTLPLVNSFNLIGDDSHALLISNSIDEEDFEYGAVYTDKESIDNIKELFESSWNIASDLDISSLNEE